MNDRREGTPGFGSSLRDARPEIVAACEALAVIIEPLFRRLDELEQQVRGLEAPAWLTIEQAADHLHSTPSALRARARRGQLAGAVRDGARWLVDRRALDATLTADGVFSDNESGRAPRQRPRPGTGG